MKLIVLLGQTASGKSEMAVNIAKKLQNAWIVSCDSRQIYRNLNLGTGKVEGRWDDGVFLYKGIAHFLIDYVDPKKYYSLADYINDWISLFKNPPTKPPEYIILVGGTGLYAKAIVEEYDLGMIKEEFEEDITKYKNKIDEYSLGELQQAYQKKSGKDLNNSDYNNPRRLQNWLLRKKSLELGARKQLRYPKFDQTYQFAINIDSQCLEKNIHKRLLQRTEEGMVEEVKNLKLDDKRILDFGLEYKVIKQYLLGELTEPEWIKKLEIEINQYAKRQLTWLKKQPVKWIKSEKEIIEVLEDEDA